MFFEGDAEFGGAVAHVVAIDAAGEGFVFEAFFDGVDFEIEDAFGRANVGASDEEAGKFVASEKGVLERSLPGNIAIVSVRKNGADELFRVAAFAKNSGAFGGMFLVGGVGVVGEFLVVKIVEQRSESPKVFVGARFFGVSANAGFDGEHVFAQGFGLREFADKLPGVFAGRQSVVRHRPQNIAEDAKRKKIKQRTAIGVDDGKNLIRETDPTPGVLRISVILKELGGISREERDSIGVR